MLMDNGANVNTRDTYSQTPLLKSINADNRVTELLLKNGACTEGTDVYGNTALSEAIFRNRADQIRLLLRYGAKTNQLLDIKPGRRVREGDVSILHFVAWYGDIEVMRAFEGTEQVYCDAPRPIDDFEQHRALRLMNGLGVGEEDREAFGHLMSTVRYLHDEDDPCIDSESEESNDGDNFTDAEEYA